MKTKIYYLLFAIVTVSYLSCKKQKNTLPLAVAADRTNWTVTADSYEKDDEYDPPKYIIDGVDSTYWQSQYAGYDSEADSLAGNIDYNNFIKPFPHWLLIDMKTPIHMVSVELTTRNGNSNGFTNFNIVGSNDEASWDTLGTFKFVPTIYSPQSFPVASGKAYRYLKLNLTSGPNPYTFLEELNVYKAAN